jgi:hypothetical protein
MQIEKEGVLVSGKITMMMMKSPIHKSFHEMIMAKSQFSTELAYKY